MGSQSVAERFHYARSAPSLTVLEGLHTLKHAIRFDAELIEVRSPEVQKLMHLAANLAPDVVDRLERSVKPVPADVFEQLAPSPPHTGVIAIARRPRTSLSDMLNDPRPAPVVLLEEPVHLGNIGAAVRVAAAAGAAGVVTTGVHDPWHPTALRGGVGLQYALPVTQTATPPTCDRPLVAVDPEGAPLEPGAVPPRAMCAFGSERSGLSQDLLTEADSCIGIPMRTGVSSLNLATAVTVVLYAWRFEQ